MSEDMEFLPKKDVLSLEELDRLCNTFIDLGVKKLRITGGEPLVRKNIMQLFSNLGKKLGQGLEELTLTTNGSQLDRYAKDLYDNGVRRINVSLDSLDKDKFKKITRIGDLEKVVSGIMAAKKAELKIKINSTDGKEITGGFSLSVGNPHVIFFVENINQFNIKDIGPKIENHEYFPEKCNVTLASIKNKKHVKVNVWERGAGLTKACGTAACATAVAGAVLRLNERYVDIEFPEGLLNVDWKANNNIYMTGKVSEVKKITVNI